MRVDPASFLRFLFVFHSQCVLLFLIIPLWVGYGGPRIRGSEPESGLSVRRCNAETRGL